jgi:hemoglobin/transferrin/lactoferrin receptor protein
VGVLSHDQWKRWIPRDLSEVLDYIPGVTKGGDGIWASTVQIRGFGEDRYVSLVDGNRIETASDLAGALSTFDMGDVEKVEVIKGGISSLYGSGALGGAINVISKQAEYSSQPYFRGSTSLDYHSVNRLWAPRLTLYSGSKNWKAKVHFGYRDALDARSPDGPIVNSRFSDWNFSGRIAFRPFSRHELSVDYQKYNGNAGIPGGDVFPVNATASYLDFDRDLVAVEYKVENPLPAMKNIRAKYYRQEIFRNVEMQPNVPPKTTNGNRVTLLRLNPTARHLTDGVLIEGNWNIGSRHELIVGWDIWQRRLESRRTRQMLQEKLDDDGNVVKELDLTKGETPIPDSRFKSNGIFFQYDLEMHSKWNLTTGARMDWITLSNEESRDPEYVFQDGNLLSEPPGQIVVYPETSATDNTWALHTGILHRLSEDISLTASFGRSYRAPSLEERYKYINLGHTVELGNPDLVPEKGNFINAGIKLKSAKIQVTGDLFVNTLENMIAMAPTDSVSFMISNDTSYSPKVFARRYKNIDDALLSGFEMGIDWWLYPAGVIYGQLSFVRGIDRSSGGNLPQIAPLNGIIGLRQKVPAVGVFEFRARYFGAQNHVAEGEVISDSYLLLDAFVESVPLRVKWLQFRLSVGIENLANTRYRNHIITNRGNWNLEPGRNIRARLSIMW